MLKQRLIEAMVLLATTAPALAHHKPGHNGGPPKAAQVPEIDASAGLLALAAVGAVLLLAWERRRRLTTSAD